MIGPTELPQPFRAGAVPAETVCGLSFYRGETPNLDRAMALVDEHRRTECESYGDCLDHAAREEWQGFTCQGCERFGRRS